MLQRPDHARLTPAPHARKVEPEALRLLSSEAMTDIAHLLRPGHLQQLANLMKDTEARAATPPTCPVL